MGIRRGDALRELLTMAAKSYDMVCSGLWPNPSPEALQIIARESVRIARKVVFLQTVHENDCVDLHKAFRELGYAPVSPLAEAVSGKRLTYAGLTA